jgi:hypothetical protein
VTLSDLQAYHSKKAETYNERKLREAVRRDTAAQAGVIPEALARIDARIDNASRLEAFHTGALRLLRTIELRLRR